MSFRDQFIAASSIGPENYDVTINACKRILDENAEDYFALSMLALCNEWKGDFTESIVYADKILTRFPNDLNILLLSARYWFQRGDEERTYHFVCRALENQNETPSEIPEWLFQLMKPLSLFKKFRGLEGKARNDAERTRKYREDQLQWAKQYKNWYESRGSSK